MSAPTLAPAIDVSDTAPTPFGRLLRTEMRKAYDTRSGLWLLISIAALTAFVMIIQLAVGVSQDLVLTFHDFMTSTTFSIGFLLPVLGILLVTSEWSQRTAMVTFSLEPRRGLVILAKAAVGVIYAALSVAIALALASVCTLLFEVLSDAPTEWDFTVKQTLFFLLLQVVGMLTGFAFAALLLSSPAAIVVFFAYSFLVPTIFAIATELIGWFRDIQPWIDFGDAQIPLFEGGGSVSGQEWAHLAVSGLIWLVLPLAVGVWRVLRTEVK